MISLKFGIKMSLDLECQVCEVKPVPLLYLHFSVGISLYEMPKHFFPIALGQNLLLRNCFRYFSPI